MAKGKKFLGVADMSSFFHQFRVKQEDRDKLSVVSHRGHEQYNVAIMGFKNSPPYAQRQIDKLLRDTGCNRFAKAYMDDIFFFGDDLQNFCNNINTLFTALDSRNLTVAGSKVFLGFPSLTLLGQHVNGLGLSTADDKIAALKALKFPDTVKDLETYLGMTGWLRQYIPFYAAIAEPLQKAKTEALKKAPAGGHSRLHFTSNARIEPTPELLDAFNDLQRAFATPKMLVHFDRERPLYILIDASKKRGFGACICHISDDKVVDNPVRTKTQPIMFLSKTLSPPERRYWPTELEVACLVWTTKRVRWMVEACEKPVTVLTDHSATIGIVRQTSLTSSSVDKLNNRLTRASQYLSQFGKLRLVYVPGREHICENPALSSFVQCTVRGYPDVYSTKQVPFYEVVKLKRRKGKRGKHPALPISQSSPLR